MLDTSTSCILHQLLTRPCPCLCCLAAAVPCSAGQGSAAPVAVAIKAAVAPGLQQLLQHEAAVYARLQGLQGVLVPHLVAHGPGVGGHGYFLATEYLEGAVPLCPSSNEAVRDAALAALGAVHAAGVAHGDLRASNILVQGSKVWLIDFTHSTADAERCILLHEEQLLLRLCSPAAGTAAEGECTPGRTTAV